MLREEGYVQELEDGAHRDREVDIGDILIGV
jgi:hypothetical protein